MYHRSHRFGQIGKALPCDVRGWVPEKGDHYLQFSWHAPIREMLMHNDLEQNRVWWAQFVEQVELVEDRLMAQYALDMEQVDQW